VRVEFFRHNLEEADIQEACEVLRSVFLTTGPRTAEFERRFGDLLGGADVVAVTSGTDALLLALRVAGVGAGDEVITTPMSFCATANAILEVGAQPVFVDVEDDTGNLDARLVEAAVTQRTRAILPVHLYGQMADMRALRDIADARALAIVEDAAHCVEGTRDGVRPGELGDAACFSFYATKNLTCGEGGAVAVTDSPDVVQELRRLRLHGIDASAADRYTGTYRHWDMTQLGYKCNMDDIHAALLVHQLDRLEAALDRRDAIWRRYEEGLACLDGVRTTATRGDSRHARHMFTIQVAPERRDAVLQGLQERGIGVAVNFRAIHTLAYYRQRYSLAPGAFPRAERIGSSTITLPLYPLLRDEQVDFVVEAIHDVMSG
jgi:dTDP-4-amino-4,6-dideoxygalactose transaminase